MRIRIGNLIKILEDAMAKTKKLPGQEPLLSAVARKLGRAAGTLAKVTHEVTGSLSSVTDAARVGEATPKQGSTSRTRGRNPTLRAVAASGARKRKPASKRASRTKSKRGARS